ncbi:MAG TPA: aminoglycoside 6-adenylyltransferase [Lacunisphaera sp.]|nr:aminoglycoside 6-adenylyltransferase [Lacunisphaera sp.]
MISKCWSAHFERTERMVTKVSAVFENGYEADFVLLPSWQMKLVFFAMRCPWARQLYPRALRRGIENQRMVAGRGYRVILGQESWERRYSALASSWPAAGIQENDFEFHCAGFWRHAVWTAKKLMRGELRASARWFYVEMRDHLWAVLEMDAELDGRRPRPEARQAEHWLAADKLRQTGTAVASDKAVLSQALLGDMELFKQTSMSVANRCGFHLQAYDEIYTWLCANLKPYATNNGRI